jgi:UDP-GlcNAc:undecaprenyl-phosphate GlcNAc-1-phosphate transferase
LLKNISPSPYYFIDGLDGLASGICAIITFSFFIISFIQSQTKVLFFQKQLTLSAILSLIICGSCLGFLFYNFYPAKIFLGDCGALILGFFIGSIGIAGLLKVTTIISLFIPVLIIGVPVSDLSFVILRRFMRGKHLMKPDKGHIHHLLLKLGWSQREIVFLMYVVTLLLSLIAVGFSSARVVF